MTRIDKKWGYEEIYVTTELYTYKKLKFCGNKTMMPHYHVNKDETFYCNFGTGELVLDNNIIKLSEGVCVRVLPGQIHSIRSGNNNLEIIEVSTYDDPNDTVRLT